MTKTKIIPKLLALSSCLLLLYFIFGSDLSTAYANHLTNRSLQLSTATASVVAEYNFSFDLASSSDLGSISFQFCSNDAIIGDTCTAPSGFDVTTANLLSQSGQTGFTISGSSTANDLIVSRSPATPALVSTPVNYIFSNITNPSSAGSYFVRLETFSNSNASGTYVDYGGLAFSINTAINISATVPPYLLFCTGLTIPEDNCDNATGDFIDFGNLGSSQSTEGTSQMLAATNAASGYDISVYGTTLESGNDVITAMSSPNVSRPGTDQFGLNLRANTSPVSGQDPSGPGIGLPTANYNLPNFYTFNSGDVIASSTKPDLDRLYTDDYLVNVAANQTPGVYVTTLTYICLATF